eukprot:CAMPEP_0182824708 /NCGR_PEP_ID=MMETSP0006_2-20121128/15439_1 /TAXON_ID=97485 /ORGANISM="Prymnesium parvum, Strain Texoma1" /LENGTH=41 /DNA_ID= /DNA_START= /DNA_END= /DNA_ORIENTATION=
MKSTAAAISDRRSSSITTPPKKLILGKKHIEPAANTALPTM